MKTIKQLFRQPLKTLLGMILMTLAVAVLCICVGQALAAQTTKKDLDERFSTVAIPSLQEDLTGAERIHTEEELLQWLEKMAQEHPDIIQGLAPNRLLSAYIPQLLPYNIQARENVSNHEVDAAIFSAGLDAYAGSTHYDSAMLVIKLETISEPMGPMDSEDVPQALLPRDKSDSFSDYVESLTLLERENKQQRLEEDLRRTDTEGYSVELTGTVTQVLSLPDGLRDPVGMTARLTLTLPSAQEIEALELEPGREYIVYGMDYFDEYQFLAEYMKIGQFKHISFEPIDPELLRDPTEEEIKRFSQNKRIDAVKIYNHVPLEQWQYNRLGIVSMTLCAPINMIPYQQILDDAGQVVDRIPQTQVTYTDGSGNTVTLSAEEFDRLYAIPTIAPLDGSAEDFLASAEGEKWRAAIEQAQVNNHAFAVVGVDEMHQVASFALGKTQIGEGREFTAEEIASGAKVCIVHEWVSNNAGLQIGDTITLSFYHTDYGLPYQMTAAQDKGLLRPAASLYFGTTPFVETAEYTIVGFWQGNIWPDADENYYNFSANTVFVPNASVQTPMEQCSSIAFVSAVLENGMINQFHDLAKRSGYAGRFKYCDQDYSEIAANFHNYESLAGQIVVIGAALYVILLLLFLLLYPAAQRKTVRTMESLGCTYGKRFGHVLLSAMTIMVTASVLGCLMGSQLWDRVVAALQATAETSITLQLEPGVLAVVAAAQLVLALLLSILVALFTAVPRGLSARR